MRLVLEQELPLSIASVKVSSSNLFASWNGTNPGSSQLIDPALGKSLAHLQEYVVAKETIDADESRVSQPSDLTLIIGSMLTASSRSARIPRPASSTSRRSKSAAQPSQISLSTSPFPEPKSNSKKVGRISQSRSRTLKNTSTSSSTGPFVEESLSRSSLSSKGSRQVSPNLFRHYRSFCC